MNAIDYGSFAIRDDYFDHPSLLHGVNHTYRVMYLVLKIGKSAGFNHEIAEAFCAAFIHDMSRRHDGYCTRHGDWAAKRKLPFFKDMFSNVGIGEKSLKNIELAVTHHSMNEEIDTNHPAYKTTALLKDADALDRIRIGENNLNIKFLRLSQSADHIAFARKLFYASNHRVFTNFGAMLYLADRLHE